MRAAKWITATTFCLSAIPALAQVGQAAQSATTPAPTIPMLPIVTVEGHYDNAVGSSNAASQGMVRGELLQDLPLLRPGEILETVPGLVVTQHSGDGKANQYFLRGYNLDHGTDFATSVDGVSVNMPTNAHGQGYSDLNFLIPELVDHIDYRKGPYFAQNGDFASAGSADIRYRKSLAHNIIDLTGGAYGYRRALMAGSLQLTQPPQDGSDTAAVGQGPVLLGALEVMRNNGPWALKEDMHKTNALLRLSDGNLAKGWSIDGIYYDAKWNSTDQVPLELIEAGQLGRFSALDPTDGGESGRARLSGEWHSHDASGYTRISAYAEHYRLKLWSNFTFFELRPATGDQFQQAESRNILGTQIVKGWTHGLLGHDSTTELGLQVRHDNIDVSLKNSEARIPFETVSDDKVSETLAGLYLQNTTIWSDWLRTLVGVRADRVNMDMTSYSLPQNSGSAAGSRVSPKLSLIFGPWAKTEFFVNAGKGFHSNDARGVINTIDPTTGTPASPVPALAGSSGKEIGVRTEIIDGLQSSLALWSLDSDSEIIYAADSSIGSTSPNGASKRHGIEWNNHWIVNRWLLLDADFAWTHARYAKMNDNDALGNMIPNAVSKVALLRLTLQRLGPWSAGLETRYIGPYPLAQDGSLTAQSAIVTNLRLQRQITPQVSLSMDALNLFNRQYYDIAYQQDYQVSPGAGAVPSGVTVHPGEPRQLRLTLRLSY
ncbi:TonB-dependent receptor [Collimonas pratensis]|uniref:TonB dependent receptor family protein n=1 Tax=Collimonas pratensis TaxID=279113 RepID=A0A127Q7J8_9BURK|nr:TonB-dependent receptor [Collimonas pratensis]AMP05966.1 tonB dependent receptor family protein [Collimonas pratensis]